MKCSSINYYSHKDIDFILWDECVERSQNGNIYSLSWYLDLTSPGWDGVIEEGGGEYITVFPVTYSKKYGIIYLRTPLFCQQLGLIYTNSNSDDRTEDIFKILSSKFSIISNYSLNIGNTIKNLRNTVIKEGVTYHLSLSRPYGRIFQGFKKDKQEKIRRSFRRGVVVEYTENIDQLIELFRENIANKIPGGVIEEQYQLLKQIFFHSKKRELSFLVKASTNSGTLLSSTFFFVYKKTIIYFFSATNLEGRKNNGIEAILNYVIEKYSGTDYVLDFEGSNVPGIADFYSRFGSERKTFPIVYSNTSHPLLKILMKLRIGLLKKRE